MWKKMGGYRFKTFLLPFILVLGLASVSSAAEFWLRTETFTKTMPGGEIVTLWGFAQCSDGTYTTCNPPSSPGPTLVVPDTDPSLTIHVKNSLTGLFTEPVSLTIPGQAAATMVPTRNPDGRVRSFTHEADVNATADYSWPTFRPGTFLYQSATHQGLQIPMGLSGVVKKDAAAGEVYAGIPYTTEVVLVFSEVDSILHKAVELGRYGPGKAVTSTFDYKPKYFLINGEPFSSASSAMPAGAVGQPTLLRFLNAGADDYTPVLQGQHMTVVAEDGNPLVFPREQYALLLPAARTFDAIFTPLQIGYLPLYDRRLHLYNGATSPGGMLVFLNIADTQHTLTIAKAGTGTGRVDVVSMPGGINCITNAVTDPVGCTEAYNAGTELLLKATPDFGSELTSWSTGGSTRTTTVTMSADQTVTATFTGGMRPLTITSPNGGEKWRKGTTQAITWTSTGDPGDAVKIVLLRAGKKQTTIALIAPNTGSYNWTIPPKLPVGNTYKIRITSVKDPRYKDNSNRVFRIQRPLP
jgi:FtsP/CotA-like multicopper oxidase with cupredoxin domain